MALMDIRFPLPKREKCIFACANARCKNGKWSCPMFTNVEPVWTATKGGVECRMFERRRDDGA